MSKNDDMSALDDLKSATAIDDIEQSILITLTNGFPQTAEAAANQLVQLRTNLDQTKIAYQLAVHEAVVATGERNLANHSLNECRRERDERTAAITDLRAEIDHYDKICTDVRNELTAAGISELTEDRLTVLPLAKRVSLLRAREQVVTAKLYTALVRFAEAKRVIKKCAEEDAFYGIEPRPLITKWLADEEAK